MSLLGKLLISKFSKNSIFHGKVILIVAEDDLGILGVVLNGESCGRITFTEDKSVLKEFQRFFDQKVESKELIDDFYKKLDGKNVENFDLTLGGLRGTGITFIHGYEEFDESDPEDDEDTFVLGSTLQDEQTEERRRDYKISDGVYYGSPQSLVNIIMEELAHENKFKILVGRTEWTKDQIDEEIKMGLWEVVDSTPELVFDNAAVNELTDDAPDFDMPVEEDNFFGWNPND